MTASVHLKCNKCGEPRTDADAGTALCCRCRWGTTQVTSHEVRAAFDRCDRTRGGSTPRVAWITERAPQWIWRHRPPDKENPTKVLIIELDAPA